MWSQGQPSSTQGWIFPMSPPKTEAGLPAPPVNNVDNMNSLMPVGGEVIISSSSFSKLPLKRPNYHYLDESEPLEYFLDPKELDDLIPEPDHPRPVAAPPVQEAGLPESSTKKRKKTKKEIDKDFRERQKLKKQKLENNFEKSQMENTKLEVLLAIKGEKNDLLEAQNAQLSAALESARIDVAKMEKNVAQFKMYEDKREQTIPRLLKLIEEDVSSKISKEDLWAQFCSPINGMQTFEKYWEENLKYKKEMRAIVETLLLLLPK